VTDRILTLDEVYKEKIVPLNRSALYEAAKEADSPFWMRKGRWLTVESDLLKWVRTGEKTGRHNRGRVDPMPPSKLIDRVREINAKS